MTMPYYASPEQLMRDRSEYARKGISRGRSVAVVTYADGVLFIAENPSSTLHKVGELYDRIGFAAVGRYSEFESLRVAGVRLADVRGYSYNRRDVTGRVIANAYAQTLGAIFTEQTKPYEVELCVAEVGDSPENDQPPEPGSPAERFEQFCAQNPGACGAVPRSQFGRLAASSAPSGPPIHGVALA